MDFDFFLHSTIDTYIADAERENKTKLVEVWNNIKQDKQEHLDMLKNCLENEVEKGELNKQSNVGEGLYYHQNLSQQSPLR